MSKPIEELQKEADDHQQKKGVWETLMTMTIAVLVVELALGFVLIICGVSIPGWLSIVAWLVFIATCFFLFSCLFIAGGHVDARHTLVQEIKRKKAQQGSS